MLLPIVNVLNYFIAILLSSYPVSFLLSNMEDGEGCIEYPRQVIGRI